MYCIVSLRWQSNRDTLKVLSTNNHFVITSYITSYVRVVSKGWWLSCHLVTSSTQLWDISPVAAEQNSASGCIIGYISTDVLQPHLGHSLHSLIQINVRTDCNSTPLSPLGKLLWGQEKLKKLARSQVPDSDCDYDEVSSCYYCWLCQISEISTVSTPCSGPASFINREEPMPIFL